MLKSHAERTEDLYEQMSGYPMPPEIPLPDPEDTESLDWFGVSRGSLSFKVLQAALVATGFRRFQQRLSTSLDEVLRHCNVRQSEIFAPIFSATVALANDPRNPSPVDRAATLILAARQLYRSILSGTLPPDQYQDQALEMGQYPNLFSTSIVWDSGTPRIFKSTDTTHITVTIARRLYALPLGDLEAELSIEYLQETLRGLVSRAHHNRLRIDESSLGLFTCAKNATQRKAFRLLQKDPANRDALASLRHSFLTLCLDLDHAPESDAEAARIAHSGNYANRWYHASLQIVVFGNGKACAICNYGTYLDGNVMMRGASELQQRAAQELLLSPPPSPTINLPPATELNCRLDPALTRRAHKDVHSILDHQQATFEIQQIGRQTFVEYQIDPIPAFIVALQMTTTHFLGKSARIEQFLTMSKYRCMGLITALVTTPEIKRFIEKVHKNSLLSQEIRTLFQAAIDSQVQACRKARRYLPLPQILQLFIYSRTGLQKVYVAFIAALVMLFLRKTDAFHREVLVSHPGIFPEVPLLGRPGVRLPYVKYFALHYQMFENSTVITMMPAVDWTIPNAEFIAVLEENLQRLQDILKGI